jgi:hypothetical protein
LVGLALRGLTGFLFAAGFTPSSANADLIAAELRALE